MITRILSCDSPQPLPDNATPPNCFRKRFTRSLLTGAFALTLLAFVSVSAQVNGTGQRSYLGWSTFSEQTINSGLLTQASVAAESDALASSGLQVHGFQYINIDSGWQGSFDANGRPIPNTATFPDIKALVSLSRKFQTQADHFSGGVSEW
jgi:alpha-galactosidase